MPREAKPYEERGWYISRPFGEYIITGLTSARIPWPIAKRPGSRGRTLAVYGDLAEAVRRESVAAVAYWWGITAQTVTKWRKEMGVWAMTEGTVLLKVTSATISTALAAARERGKGKHHAPDTYENYRHFLRSFVKTDVLELTADLPVGPNLRLRACVTTPWFGNY